MSLLEHIQMKMKPEPGKATLADLVLAKNEIPEALIGDIETMPAVPDCITEAVGVTADGLTLIEVKPDRMLILAWIQSRREQPDLTKEEVADMVSLADNEAVVELTKRINWFWSDLSREEFERRWVLRIESTKLVSEITPVEGEGEEEEEPTSENPTPSESS